MSVKSNRIKTAVPRVGQLSGNLTRRPPSLAEFIRLHTVRVDSVTCAICQGAPAAFLVGVSNMPFCRLCLKAGWEMTGRKLAAKKKSGNRKPAAGKRVSWR